MSPAKKEPSLPEKILAIDRRLSESRIPHAFGGALALAYYAEPRATIDIDLNVFAKPSSYERVLKALAPLGVAAGPAPEEVEREGQCRIWWGRTPVDLFFAYDEIHDAMRTDARSVPFADTKLKVLSPEHLLICKAVFDRPKDWLDIEQILVSVDALDLDGIESWMVRLVGKSDPRTQRLRKLVARQ